MKTVKQVLIAAAAVTFMMSSCTVEKRLYTSGYHIDWFQGKSKVNENKTKQESKKQHKRINKSENNNLALASKKSSDYKISFSFDQSVVTASSVSHDNNDATENASVFANKEMAKKIVTDLSTFDYDVNENDKVNIQAKEESSSDSGKSQLIALILVIVIGGLGVHRFYLGYIGIGILQLLTAGGCGIWWLIDLIRIATGDLGPKDGSYSETI